MPEIDIAALMAPLGPFERPPSVAVAVSGGSDSLGLGLLLAGWVQARDGYFWAGEEVAARLRRLLVRAFGQVDHTAREHEMTWREAATMLAVARVAEATLVRGIYP